MRKIHLTVLPAVAAVLVVLPSTVGLAQGGAKWSQPPEPVGVDLYTGWDEYSVYGTDQIVADDWQSTDPEPVTGIRWWGSFVGSSEVDPPYVPESFHICMWTDVPASVAVPWSHPGEVIWETYCDNFTWELAGWDVDPRDPDATPDACFKFEQGLDPDQLFRPDGEDTIYWISIAAYYSDVTPPAYPWGWTTRPHYFNDLAVRIVDPADPSMGTTFVFGPPIAYPHGGLWDMAFELTKIPTPTALGDVKNLPVNTPVVLKDKVLTADFTASMDLFYMEEENRTAGIGVRATTMLPALTVGDRVTVSGTTFLLDGSELAVSAQEVLVEPGEPISALQMNNRSTGGGDFGAQPAVVDDASAFPAKMSAGFNSVGMLIRSWGTVTYYGSGYATPSITGDMFWIDDGTGLMDGFAQLPVGNTVGIAVLHPSPVLPPTPGDYLGVTGILRAIPNESGEPVRLLVPRDATDIKSF